MGLIGLIGLSGLSRLQFAAPALAADVPTQRWRAAIELQHPGVFVQLPLPAEVHRRSLQPGLADLRVVDADGARAPHAWLPAPPATEPAPLLRAAALYPLPPQQQVGDAALDIVLDGDRVRVHAGVRRGAATAPAGKGATVVPGWIVDLGPRPAGSAVPIAPTALRMQWSGPVEFSATATLSVGSDLRSWRPVGSAQLVALASPQGAGLPLVQRELPLPAGVPRFVRLQWAVAAGAPRLTSVQAVTLTTPASVPDESTELRLPLQAVDQAWQADLGAALPLRALDLALPAGTRVLPVRVQGRLRDTEAWQPLGATVFYQLDDEGGGSRSPALDLNATVRHLRLLPDPRAGTPEVASVQLVVQVRTPRLLFAAQGRPPYALLAGSADAQAGGALPLSTLLPPDAPERTRDGQARLGAFTEVATAAQAAESARRRDALRPWVLWAVLGAGVAGLGAMVWRLARRPLA